EPDTFQIKVLLSSVNITTATETKHEAIRFSATMRHNQALGGR
ncbi:unnamed protein product, partial [Rhizoctonia solani]